MNVTPRTLALGSLLLAALHGVLTELYMRRGFGLPPALTTMFTLGFCVLAYVWYHRDARHRQWPRKPWLSAFVILMPFIGVPLYAAVSRPAGARAGAALRALGFVALLLFTSVATGISLQIASGR